MADSMSSELIAKNALEFVNLLVPGGFDEARFWVAPECTYKYSGETLKGSKVIDSFEDNHEKAKKELDSIQYLDGEVKKIEGNKIYVRVKDRLEKGSCSHLYEDCLIVTCNEKQGLGSIVAIEHSPIPEEREKLKEFLSND